MKIEHEIVEILAKQEKGWDLSTPKGQINFIQHTYFNNWNLIDRPTEGFFEWLVEERPEVIQELEKPSEQLQLIVVKKHARNIQYIKNPTKKVQHKATCDKFEYTNIQYIENPEEEVQLKVVDCFPLYIKRIKNPSEKTCLLSVSQHPSAIKYIENPSEKVKLTAVSAYGEAIEYIKNPSEEVQLAAIRKWPQVIKYIENPSETVPLELVKLQYYSIYHIANPTESVIEKAAWKDPNILLKYPHFPLEKTIKILKSHPYVSSYNDLYVETIKKCTKEEDLIYFLETRPYYICYIQNPSQELIFKAVEISQYNFYLIVDLIKQNKLSQELLVKIKDYLVIKDIIK